MREEGRREERKRKGEKKEGQDERDERWTETREQWSTEVPPVSGLHLSC